MSSTAFHSPEPIPAAPIRTFELHFIPVRQAVLEFPHPAAKGPHDETFSKPDCIRGVQVALVIEAAVALLIYGLWQVSHLLR